jgi:hypothetical protein
MPQPAAVVEQLEARLRPLSVAVSEAWWEASVRAGE